MQEGEERACGSCHRGLEDIAIAGAVGGGLAVGFKAGPAFFLHAAVEDQAIPAAKEPGWVKAAPRQQVAEQEDRNLRHRFRSHSAGVMGGMVRTGDGGLAVETRVLGGLVAQPAHIPRGLTGLALLVKAVARTFAGQIGGDDLPPEVSGHITAHRLHARIGQGVQPGVELGKNRPHDPQQDLGAQEFINAWERFAARWFAR